MKYITLTEEEMILAIATHPNLDPGCWRIVADAKRMGPALEQALGALFPAETRACWRIASDEGSSFWRAAHNFVELRLFQRTALSDTLPAPAIARSLTRHLPTEQIKQVLRHPALGHPWWSEDTIFHDPPPVDDYLLMSHTS